MSDIYTDCFQGCWRCCNIGEYNNVAEFDNVAEPENDADEGDN